jgi:hypothetical protein
MQTLAQITGSLALCAGYSLVILISLGLLFWIAGRVIDSIHCRAMASSRDDLARELRLCAIYLTREPDAKLALEITSDMIIAGFVPTGDQVRQKFAESKFKRDAGMV